MNTGKRIVLTTHGTLGDLHPFIAVALELQKRGHHPLIATSEYHRRKVEAEGIDFNAIRPDIFLQDKELHRRLTEPKRGMERCIRDFMLPVIRDTYDDLLDTVQTGGGADLLISQILIFAAPLVAEKTGIRWISTELQPGAFMSAYDPPVMAPVPFLAKLRPLGSTFHRALFAVAKLPARLWVKPIKQLRSELGLSPDADPLFTDRNSPHLVLALFSRAFAEPQPDWAPNTIVTGFPFYDENESNLNPELERFFDAGEPPIVFTLGSSAVWDAGNFYVESISAVQKLGKRAVLLIGGDPLNQPSETLPENIIAIPYAPFAKIFPRASVIVHQGGVGTTGQGLRAGKPMLVMPYGGDQFDNGARIERLGAGHTIVRKQYRSDQVATRLKQLFDDPNYRKKAEDLGRRVEAENGVRAACDAIEGQLDYAD
jgi:UDP:flavonoid glycosyltransferase YjiC (YdhE family)